MNEINDSISFENEIHFSKKIEDIIEFNKENKKIEFKENIKINIEELIKDFQNEKINDNEKKELLVNLKQIFINFREIANIFLFTKFPNIINILIDFILYNEKLKEISIDLLKYFIQNITLEKKSLDYIFEKIGNEHREKKLTDNKLFDYLNLLSLFYGQGIEVKKFIPKKYFYFFDKSKSKILTNFNQDNNYIFNENFLIYFCFCIDEYCQNENTELINITFSNLNQFIVKLDEQKISVFEKEKNENKKFQNLQLEIKYNEWVIIKFYIENKENITTINLEKINNECEKKSENYSNIKNNLISSISFVKNFKGKLSYILSSNYNFTQIDLDFIFNKFNKCKLEMKKFNFIFSPYLFNDKTLEIIDPINNNKAYLFNPENNFYQNYIFNYSNYTKNIFMIGGIYPLIPLFEFFYNFINNEERINKEFLIEIFNKLMDIILLINNKSKKNSSYLFESKFYKCISLFIENLDSEMINKSKFIDFILKITENEINGKLKNNHFYSSLFFNFKIINKLNLEKKNIIFENILKLLQKNEKKNRENIFLKILKENWTSTEIFFNINEYNEITDIIYKFLNEIYPKIKEKDDSLIFLFNIFFGKKCNQKIIDLIINILNQNLKDIRLKEIIKSNFDEKIILFLKKEKNIKLILDVFNFIQNLSTNFPIEMNIKSEKLTNFLISNFEIKELPNEFIERGKNLMQTKPEKIYHKYFYEWLNILFRLKFIKLIDINQIDKINFIDPYREFNDDFIYGIIYLIQENEIKFTHEILELYKINNISFINQLYKLIFFIKFLEEKCSDKKLLDMLENQSRIFQVFISNLNEIIDNESIKTFKELFFEVIQFELNEPKKEINNKSYSVNFMTNIILNIKQNKIGIEIINNYSSNIKIENNEKPTIDKHIMVIYQKNMEYINKFIKFINSNLSFKKKNIIKLPIVDEIKDSVDNFIITSIINEEGQYIIKNKLDEIIDFPNELLNLNILDFFTNYLLYNLENINIEDYQKIIFNYCFFLCCKYTIRKRFIFFNYTNELKNDELEVYSFKFLELLKLIFLISFKNEQFQLLFKPINFFFKKISEIINKNQNLKNLFIHTPFTKLNKNITDKTEISLLNGINFNFKIEDIIIKLIKNEKYNNSKIQIQKVDKIQLNNNNIELEDEFILKNNFEIQIKNQVRSFSKFKLYKKIKYEQFTWNGSYSDKNLFFYFNSNKKNLKLNYKKANHLTKEKINPLIIPMIYVYDYNTKHLKDKFYNDNINTFYIIPLPKINFKNDILINNYKNAFENYYYKCCMLTIKNHYKGLIFFKDDCFIFIEIELKNTIKCYGTLVQSDKNSKYRKIKFKDINYFFNRRFYDDENSIEIYTSNNKSYYFIFDDIIIKDKFYEKLTQKTKIEIPTIEKIQNKWYENQISNLEYLMWINILGNRSLKDIYQYPVFPWLITNYKISTKFSKNEIIESKIIEEIINNLIEKSKRDFDCPLGLMELNNKGKKRKQSYINQYISSIITLSDELDLNNEIKEKFQKLNQKFNIENNEENKISKSSDFKEIIEEIKSFNIKNKNSYNYNDYKLDFDIYEKLKDKNIELINFPYLFDSHFSNSGYISHFLNRIFPFTLIAIEIQGNEFDIPNKLFINLEKTFDRVTSEKSDLVEIIPEFFFFPEMFLNINNLNLGKLLDNKNKNNNNNNNNIKNNNNNIKNNNNITNNNNTKINTVQLTKLFFNSNNVNDVFLPFWCKNNPYLFIY